MHRHTLSASKAGGLDRARLPWSAGDSGRDQRQSGLGAWERGRAGRGKSVLRPCGDCVGCRPMGGPRPARAGPPLCMRQVPSTPTPTPTHTHSHSHTHTPHILFGRLCRPLHTPTHPPFRPTWLPRCARAWAVSGLCACLTRCPAATTTRCGCYCLARPRPAAHAPAPESVRSLVGRAAWAVLMGMGGALPPSTPRGKCLARRCHARRCLAPPLARPHSPASLSDPGGGGPATSEPP